MNNGWPIRSLGEVLDKTETINPLQSPEVEFDYIDVSSISNQTFKIEVTQRLKGKDAPSRARRVVKANDVLFATVRPTLQRIAVVPEHLDNQVCSTGYVVLRPTAGVDHRFLFYSLFTDKFMAQMESLQKGTSYPAVTDGEVRAQMIRIPSIDEQRRIVAILDEAFAGIAIAKTNAEKNFENARTLFSGYLHSFFTDSVNSWEEKPLETVARILNGYAFKSTDFSAKAGVKCIKITNVGVKEFICSVDSYLPDSFRSTYDAVSVKKGSIALALTRSIIARGLKVAVVPDEYDGALLNQRVASIATNDKELKAAFLFAYLSTETVADYVRERVNTLMQPNLSITDLRLMPVPMPPRRVQDMVIKQLDNIRDDTMRLASVYERKCGALDELRKSLLQRAFAGELTKETHHALVIPFPARISNIGTTDLHAGILAIAFQLHETHGMQKFFGEVKAEKIAHMVESYLGIELDRNPVKDAAGPNDYPHLKKVESRAAKAGYFLFKESSDGGYKITKYRRFDSLINKTRTALAGRNEDVDQLLRLMLPMKTQQAEIVATVFAAWNNLLLLGKPITAEKIVFEARENWHPAKLKIKREKFLAAIGWMRERGLVPVGQGKRVDRKIA
jgi:type I restriction enzyme S subunit